MRHSKSEKLSSRQSSPPALSPHVVIDKAHQDGRVNPIDLSHVDEKAGVSSLRLPIAFCLLRFAGEKTLFLAGRRVGRFMNLIGLLVIINKPVELERHHPFNDILLFQPLQFPKDGR